MTFKDEMDRAAARSARSGPVHHYIVTNPNSSFLALSRKREREREAEMPEEPQQETPEIPETLEEARDRYLAALHAMQTGVTASMAYDSKTASPKDLRVGLNSALVSASALAWLLIDKGIITEAEYTSKTADVMERERDMYAAELKQHTGSEIILR